MTSVIIVTHNSQSVIRQCLAAVKQQTVSPDAVVVVDSGSDEPNSLHSACQDSELAPITVLLEKNIGFSASNNLGYAHIDSSSDFVLFLNPDAFLTSDCLEKAAGELVENQSVGCVGGRLLGYNSAAQQVTGKLDSTGVFRTWYGRWYDRGQGEPDDGRYNNREELPAACGAFLFCRKKILDQIALAKGIIFDPDFFLYKEDIELCLRIRKAGHNVVYLPDIKIYHCRGWQRRRQVPRQLRLTAASSEIVLYRKHPSPYILWAFLKYMLVRRLWI